MTGLAQAGDRLEPAEDLFHSFAPPLAEPVAGVASAASIDRAVKLLRDVRCHSMLTQCVGITQIVSILEKPSRQVPSRVRSLGSPVRTALD